MSTSLTLRGGQLPDASEWKTLMEMADVFMKSGLLPSSIKSPAAAVLIMAKGRELSIPPVHALSSIVIIQGKPAASSELMASLVYRDHGDDALRFTETNATKCTISYKRRSWTARESYSFTIQDAEAAGLMANDTWRKYRPAMLRARCISAVARMAFPDTIGGLYTPEELGATVSVSDFDEPTIHVPQVVIPVNTTTGEVVNAATPPRPPDPTALPDLSFAEARANYLRVVDVADDNDVPAEHFDPGWPVEEIVAKGKRLADAIRAKRAKSHHDRIQENALAEMGSGK